MAKQTLNTIKNWFKTGLKPTQQQFWDTWDSFWHKDQVIPASSIENLDSRFDEKADEEAFDAHLTDLNAHNIGNLSIPAGPTNALTGSGTRANLFYNTTEQVLYIYDGAEWRAAVEADLTGFYTKTEIESLLNAKINTSGGTITGGLDVNGNLISGGNMVSSGFRTHDYSFSVGAEGNIGANNITLQGGLYTTGGIVSFGGFGQSHEAGDWRLFANPDYSGSPWRFTLNGNEKFNVNPNGVSIVTSPLVADNPSNYDLLVRDISTGDVKIISSRSIIQPDLTTYAKKNENNYYSGINSTTGYWETYNGDDGKGLRILEDGIIYTHEDRYTQKIQFPPLMGNSIIEFQDKDGTVALLSDVTSASSGYAKLSGGNQFEGIQEFKDGNKSSYANGGQFYVFNSANQKMSSFTDEGFVVSSQVNGASTILKLGLIENNSARLSLPNVSGTVSLAEKSVRISTSSFTLDMTKDIELINASTGDVEVNLPQLSGSLPHQGKQVIIKRIDNHNQSNYSVIVKSDPMNVIEGELTKVLPQQWNYIILVAISNYWIVTNYYATQSLN